MVIAASCASSEAGAGARRDPPSTTRAFSPVTLPRAMSTPDVAASLRGYPAYAATAKVDAVIVFDRPDGSPSAYLPHMNPDTGGPYVFGIRSERPGWYEVLLPLRPNGRTGWLRRTDVDVSGLRHRILVNVTARTVTLFDRNRVVDTWSAGVGTVQNPTPVGHFYVLEALRSVSPNGVYGPYALGMSGHSDTLSEFNGADGRWAIHGTNEPDLIPGRISHGCVRLRNADVTTLAGSIELGDPVDVVA